MERKISHSQNFLHSQRLISRLLHNSNISPNDTIIEIGPGKGAITKGLVAIGCNVIGIEIDDVLFKTLKEKFNGNDNVKLIKDDFMNYVLPDFDYKVFSNIPFNMTAEILQKLMNTHNRASEIYLIMQYEATLKYAGTPYYTESLRSLMYKPFYQVTIEHEFSPYDFKPQPNVKVVLSHFHLREHPDISYNEFNDYCDFLNYVYTAPGRTFKEKTKCIFSYEQQKRLRKDSGISFDSVISEITYPQWINMFKCFSTYVSAEKKIVVKGKSQGMEKVRNKLNKVHRNRNGRAVLSRRNEKFKK